MFVENWMTAPAVTIDRWDTLGRAFELMTSRGVHRLPVTDGFDLVGVLTRTDLIALLGPRPHREQTALWDLPVERKMSTPAWTAHPKEAIEDAAHRMLERRISGLPVVEPGGRLVGIITRSDLYRAFEHVMGIHEPGARVVLRISSEDRLLEEVAREIGDHAIRAIVSYHDPRSGSLQAVVRLRGKRGEGLPDALRGAEGSQPRRA